MKKLVLVIVLFLSPLLAASSSGAVDLTVSVVGNVFALELQDANSFPLVGEIDLGSLEPGQADFPVQGVVVAGCKSNTGTQWSLQVELTNPLTDPRNGNKLPPGALKVRGLSTTRSPDGKKLPGNLVLAEQSVEERGVVVYTSNNRGDLGFNKYEGTYVPLGFGVAIPGAQPAGTYSGRVLLTMTE